MDSDMFGDGADRPFLILMEPENLAFKFFGNHKNNLLRMARPSMSHKCGTVQTRAVVFQVSGLRANMTLRPQQRQMGRRNGALGEDLGSVGPRLEAVVSSWGGDTVGISGAEDP